jgi:3-deoxy-D-manno-octulosonic-acid transferase
MTTTTQTGKEVIDTYTSQSRYLPYEPLLFGWLRPQKALVVMEAEFWYLLFALAQRRGAKTLLINARMSDRSFPKYQRISWLYRHIFKHIDEVYAQTAQDKKRLESLGARHVVVTGNIKLAQLPKVTRRLVRPDGPVICGASTHQGEEHLILQAFAILKEKEQNARLIIVPRHPERFERVAAEIEVFASSYGFSWHAFSKDKSFNTDITIVDRLGELVNIYAISDIVILGGAFEPVGGHNAAEAAQFGCKIISGPHYFNQKDIFSAVKGIKIIEAEALERTLLAYEALPETEITQRSDISPILQSLTQISK